MSHHDSFKFSPLLARPLFAAMLSLILLSTAEAQTKKKGGVEAEPQVVDSKADKLPIHFTYMPADKDKLGDGRTLEDAPVIILIHGQGEDRLVWENRPTNFKQRPMTEVLSDEGFAIVAVDMRGSGESKSSDGKDVPVADYPKMLGDLEAIKDFLLTKHQAKELNINKLGIVAADQLTAVALQYAAYDWRKPDYDDAPLPSQRTPRGRDVRAVALLSVANQMGGVKSLTAIAFLKNQQIDMAVFLAIGSDDPLDKGLTKRIGRQFRVDQDPEDLRLIETYETRLRGTNLIGAENIRADLHLRNFLVKAVKEPEVKWIDRRSRVMR